MKPNNDMRTTNILSDIIMRLREKELTKVIFTDSISGEKLTFELYQHSETLYVTREAL